MITLGRIAGSQGKRGELRLKFYSDPPSKLFFQKVYLQREGVSEEYEVEFIRPYKDYFILKLKAVDTIFQARELKGAELAVPEEWLKPLASGDFYLFQLIGSSVYTKEKKRVGEVVDLIFIENNDLLVVKEGEREVLIPFTASICIRVDTVLKEITVDPPEGLLELNEI
ncbi:MAG: ribosome maturation factor RimM [Candidatus Aminicenantales bacterium]